MRIEAIEIHSGDGDRPYRELGQVKVKVGAATIFSKAPTIEDVNFKLREEAMRFGADGIVKVAYSRGLTGSSWKGLTARGVAVKFESDERDCPMCAEPIERAALRCKHCGSDVSSTSVAASASTDSLSGKLRLLAIEYDDGRLSTLEFAERKAQLMREM